MKCEANLLDLLAFSELSIAFHSQSQVQIMLVCWLLDSCICSFRYFTLSDTISGLSTVLSVVAKNCHVDALRILLQHGMLEKERRPSFIINVILFSPLPLVEEVYIKDTLIRKRIDCMVLCFRVLTRVSITHLQVC